MVAAVELLIGHRFWLGRRDFVEQFVGMDLGPDGTPLALVDWDAAVGALTAGPLVCSDSQGQILRLAASLAEGIPVDLGAAVSGLDEELDRVGGGCGAGRQRARSGWSRRAGRAMSQSPVTVAIVRERDPLQGQRLRVLGRMRRGSGVELLVVLADGSKRLVPAAWTDLDQPGSLPAGRRRRRRAWRWGR